MKNMEIFEAINTGWEAFIDGFYTIAGGLLKLLIIELLIAVGGYIMFLWLFAVGQAGGDFYALFCGAVGALLVVIGCNYLMFWVAETPLFS